MRGIKLYELAFYSLKMDFQSKTFLTNMKIQPRNLHALMSSVILRDVTLYLNIPKSGIFTDGSCFCYKSSWPLI